MKKKIASILTAAVIGATVFATAVSAAPSGAITVVSREDGSGTRGAFVELFGIQEEVDGEKVDMTTVDASITNSTSVMMTTVSGDENAIGYISLGSLNDTVKAVKIDGAEASAENVSNDTYKVSRPFNIVTSKEAGDAAKDFVSYIMSAEGQQIVEDNGYIKEDAEAAAYEAGEASGKVVVAGSSSISPVMEKLKEAYQQIVEDNGYIKEDAEAAAYEAGEASGKVVVAGSSSISPVMEKLKEAYEEVNKDVTIEIQTSDSTTGINSANEGICDIGMASRELKDKEKELGLEAQVIARDGIAVVVNNENDTDELTSEQVKAIFTGETTEWEELAK